MKKEYPLVCLLVALMTTACSSMHDRDGKRDNAGMNYGKGELPFDDTAIARAAGRAIQVYVVAGDGSEDISTDEEPIHRKRHNQGTIDFQLRTTGYKFAPIAITFDDPRMAPPAGEIACSTTSPVTVSCRNSGISGTRTPGKYKFTMHLLRRDGSSLDALDPFIVNH
ncbi:MAG: hypothetical protein ACREXI_13885 [Caldimonas sp.]